MTTKLYDDVRRQRYQSSDDDGNMHKFCKSTRWVLGKYSIKCHYNNKDIFEIWMGDTSLYGRYNIQLLCFFFLFWNVFFAVFLKQHVVAHIFSFLKITFSYGFVKIMRLWKIKWLCGAPFPQMLLCRWKSLKCCGCDDTCRYERMDGWLHF